jgi:hypothetical protein
MTSDVYCNPVFVIERRQTFTVIKLHHWIAHAETMYPIKKTKMQFISFVDLMVKNFFFNFFVTDGILADVVSGYQ